MSMIKREEDKASNHLGAIIGLSNETETVWKLMNRIMCWSSCYYCSYRPHYRFREEEESEEVLDGNGEDVNITNTKYVFPLSTRRD